MFTKELTGLALASSVADSMFPNLNAENFRSDETFKATLRALLHSRVPAEESVSVFRTNSRCRSSDIKDITPEQAVQSFLQNRLEVLGSESKGIIVIHSFDNTEEENNSSFERLDAWAGQGVEVTGFESLEALSVFFGQKKIKSRFYINNKQQNVLIFLERIDIKKWHIIQSVISKYLPWYFPKDNPLTVEEAEVVKSLVGRYAPTYEEKINVFTQKFDFRTSKIKALMGGFEARFDKVKLEQIQSRIDSMSRNIESVREDLFRRLAELDDEKLKYEGLIVKIDNHSEESASELLDFCLRSKALHILEASDSGKMTFVVATTLSSFDTDLVEPLIGRRNSALYRNTYHTRPYRTDLTTEQLKKLWTEVFIKETFKIRTCAEYILDFKNQSYRCGNRTSWEHEFADFTPNVHINNYSCLGNNERYIAKAVENRDFVGAILACMNSASNINLAESSIVSRFLIDILEEHNERRCIELPNGECVTPVEAVKYIEQKEAEAEAEKTAEEKKDE